MQGYYYHLQKQKLPTSLYFLLLSIGWVPHFVLLLLANNPFRGLSSYVITGVGLAAEHGVAATIMYFNFFRLSRHSADESSLVQMAIVECVLTGADVILPLLYEYVTPVKILP
jgi:hypothetical protein